MPELPDILAYLNALEPRVGGAMIERITIPSPFLLRTFEPPIETAHDHRVVEVSRLGKRLILHLDDDLFLVLHLMIAGRLRWHDDDRAPRGKNDLAAFRFDRGTLILTEASKKKRASLHLVAGEDALAAHARGGVDILTAELGEFTAALTRESHTLKRALTDPRLFDGVGNAYSDEILHAARLPPFKRTADLTPDEIERLHAAATSTLTTWIDALRAEFKTTFPPPSKITAFRPGFAVHGKYNEPCPVCDSPVQRVIYAENEMNYCPTCQTGGRILADRSLSRLLKGDWPKTIEDLE